MTELDRLARQHAGAVHHVMDHYVMDLRDAPSGAAVYFTVYSIAYMPELGTGYVAMLRVRGQPQLDDLDLLVSDSMAMGQGMQRRMQRIEATSDVSRGIGTDLTLEPVLGTFERLPWESQQAGFRVASEGVEIVGWWKQPDEPRWLPAPSGTFHPSRDIVGTMVPFRSAELTINGVVLRGEPYPDPWWRARMGADFSSTHISLGDTAIEPDPTIWSQQ